VLLSATVAAAWALELSNPDAGGYSVAVVRDGVTLKSFTLADLRELPARRVVMQDQEQIGPAVLTLLESSGVTEYEQLRVIGMGARDDGVIVLSDSEVDRDVLLDIAERGTTKLCGPMIEWEDRVRDVVRLEVR